jgi:hypothetical protein
VPDLNQYLDFQRNMSLSFSVFNRLGREMVVRFVLIGYFFLPPLVITLAKRILRQYLMYIGFFMIKGERLFHINPLHNTHEFNRFHLYEILKNMYDKTMQKVIIKLLFIFVFVLHIFLHFYFQFYLYKSIFSFSL